MLGAGNLGKEWTFSTRFVDSEEEEERWVNVLEYRFNHKFSYGIEYNPGDKSANLLRIIWTLTEETEQIPMITISTSETRVGSVAGGHINLSFAKSLPQSPLGGYLAVHYAFDRGFEFPFGVSFQLSREVSLLPMYDGEKWNVLLNFVQKDFWVTVGTHGIKEPELLIAVGFGFGNVK
ncbi:MAG TPA: hypothetical protein VNK96_06560 [Fimbriimonadales bacterium]|nr:hypothetical protein [Fimbriimonadales bacterium]